MTCPNCGGKTRTTDTAAVYGSVLRRRKCSGCGYVFFTEEVEAPEEEWPQLRQMLNAKRREQHETNKRNKAKSAKRSVCGGR